MASPPAPAPFRFRALPLSELLDETFRLYRRHFQVIAGVAVLLVLPSTLSTLLSGSYRSNSLGALINLVQSGYSQEAIQKLQDQQALIDPFWSFLGGLLAVVLVPFTVGALYRAVIDAVMGRPLSIGSVFRGTLARYWALWGVSLLLVLLLLAAFLVGGIVVAVLTIVLAPLGIIAFLAAIALAAFLLIRLAVAIPALLVEGVGPARALRRSWDLVGGSWWRVTGILILTGLMWFFIYIVLLVFFGGIAGLVPGLAEEVRAALVTAATTLTDALISPIVPLVVTLIYFDLRVRKEGFDLEQLARETSPGPSPA